MDLLLGVIALLLALFGGYLMVMNWGCVIGSWRNQRRGIDRHYSTVPLLPQLLLGLAALPSPIVPRWLLWTVALADIGLWQTALGLIYAFRKRTQEPGE